MEINVLVDEEAADSPDPEWVRAVAQKVISALELDPAVELGIVITGQERIRELNRTYRGKDTPTDVLAFAMLPDDKSEAPFITPPDGVRHLGEVIISCPQAQAQAKEQGHSLKKELAILISHGILHLLGYDDEEPAQKAKMFVKQDEILSRIEAGI